MFLVFYHDAVK
jgi:hypothetical protein